MLNVLWCRVSIIQADFISGKPFKILSCEGDIYRLFEWFSLKAAATDMTYFGGVSSLGV